MSDIKKNFQHLYEYNVMLREKFAATQSLLHALASTSLPPATESHKWYIGKLLNRVFLFFLCHSQGKSLLSLDMFSWKYSVEWILIQNSSGLVLLYLTSLQKRTSKKFMFQKKTELIQPKLQGIAGWFGCQIVCQWVAVIQIILLIAGSGSERLMITQWLPLKLILCNIKEIGKVEVQTMYARQIWGWLVRLIGYT